tara:strand:+ start:203 stop:469 length:267 start_codon:yes stop_codon:yes gene_type:complete
MKKKVLDSWKRPAEVEIPELSERYPQQLEFNFGPRDATPEEFNEWWESELKPKGDGQLKFVAMMAVVQLLTLVFMMTAFFIIGLGLEK